MTSINNNILHLDIFIAEDGECKILLSIFGYLTTAEVCRVARVCRKWYTMSKHPNLWRRVRISEAVITAQVSSSYDRVSQCHLINSNISDVSNFISVVLKNRTAILTWCVSFPILILPLHTLIYIHMYVAQVSCQRWLRVMRIFKHTLQE